MKHTTKMWIIIISLPIVCSTFSWFEMTEEGITVIGDKNRQCELSFRQSVVLQESEVIVEDSVLIHDYSNTVDECFYIKSKDILY